MVARDRSGFEIESMHHVPRSDRWDPIRRSSAVAPIPPTPGRLVGSPRTQWAWHHPSHGERRLPRPSTAAPLDVWVRRELEARCGEALSAAHSAARHAGATASARRELVAGPRGGAVQAGGSANPTDPTYLESRDSARRSARHGGSSGGGRGAEGSTLAHAATVTPPLHPPPTRRVFNLVYLYKLHFFHVLSCSALTLVVGWRPFLGLWCYSRMRLLDTRGCPRGASSVSVVSNSWFVVL